MSQVACGTVMDLLPQYLDGVCSSQTMSLVEAHLQTCGRCKKRYEEMRQARLAGRPMDGGKSKRMKTRHVGALFLAVVLTAASVLCNGAGAWLGGPASLGQFFVTVAYMAAWSACILLAGKSRIPAKLCWAFSLLTFLSALGSLVCRILKYGGFLSAFFSTPASVPFYGLRLFLGWDGLYAAAAVVALFWTAWTSFCLRKIRKILPEKPRTGS